MSRYFQHDGEVHDAPKWYDRYEKILAVCGAVLPPLVEGVQVTGEFRGVQFVGQSYDLGWPVYQQRYEVFEQGSLVYRCTRQHDWDGITEFPGEDVSGDWEFEIECVYEMVRRYDATLDKYFVAPPFPRLCSWLDRLSTRMSMVGKGSVPF